MLKKKPPVFLNLTQIRFPATAVMSIVHRVTGVLLFLAIPFFIYTLEQSLQNAAGFQQVLKYLECTSVKIILIILFWSLLHHLLAGVRGLLLDIDIGVERQQARMTAWLVICSALALSILIVGSVL